MKLNVRNVRNSPLYLAGAAILCACTAHGQTAPRTALESKAIAKVQDTLVSQLETGMPKITLQYFLRSETGAKASIAWEMNDCGEQTGEPAVDKARDIPTCVEADVTLADGRLLSVMVAVGSVEKGVSGNPSLFSIFLNGSSKPISRLSEIPAELHRHRAPDKFPKDVPKTPTTPGA